MEPMGLIIWLLVGGISGCLASQVISTGLSLMGNIVVGLIGGFFGGLIFHVISDVGLSIWSIFVAFIGAVILLYLTTLVNGRGDGRANI